MNSIHSLLVSFSILGFTLDFGKISGQSTRYNPYNMPVDIPRTPEMIQSNGYPVESHEVQTADGYLLTMHRIPYGKSSKGRSQRDKPIVLLQHGLLSSSADWVVIGPENALGYLLADEGYDVWMGNARGNTFSRNHIKLNPNSAKYWDFTFHELAIYDLPASIDYILNETKRKKLTYVGHSQGGTILYAMLSTLPQYNDVILSGHTLAPGVFMSNAKTPLFPVLTRLLEVFGKFNGFQRNFELLPSIDVVQLALKAMCRNGSSLQNFCMNGLFQIIGHDHMQMNKTLIPAFFNNFPAGASAKQLIHFLQLYKSGHFRQFDYGTVGNMKRYGSPTPPDYPLERVTAQISIHYCDNDWLIAVEDINILRSKISNLIGAYRVPYAKFNHVDYLLAINVKALLYNDLINLINNFNQQ